MLRYEILMLANPNITDEQAADIEKQVSDLVTKSKGSVLSFDNWGKMRLSYPVNKSEYGVYFLSRYELSSEVAAAVLSELQMFFRIKVNDIILRHTCKKLDKGAALSYVKPEPVSEDSGERFEKRGYNNRREEADNEEEG